MIDPEGGFRRIRDFFLSYLDTAFRIRDRELAGLLDVALPDHVGGAAHHVLGDRSHPLDRGPHRLGHGDVRHPQPGDLRDVHGQVAHPLEVAHHPQRRDDGAQVAGDRLLQREQHEGGVLDQLALAVDRGVAADDPLGDRGVTGQEGLRREPDRRLDVPAEVGEVDEDGVELFVDGGMAQV